MFDVRLRITESLYVVAPVHGQDAPCIVVSVLRRDKICVSDRVRTSSARILRTAVSCDSRKLVRTWRENCRFAQAHWRPAVTATSRQTRREASRSTARAAQPSPERWREGLRAACAYGASEGTSEAKWSEMRRVANSGRQTARGATRRDVMFGDERRGAASVKNAFGICVSNNRGVARGCRDPTGSRFSSVDRCAR